MATATRKVGTGVERYAWTAFVGLGGILLLFGQSDLSSGIGDPLVKENALNELFVGLISIVVAVSGLRRGERWAWYALSIWPFWIVAQGLSAWNFGRNDDALSAVAFLAIAVAGLALSFRPSFQSRR